MATSLAAALVGIWLMAAPAVLGYGGVAADHDRIVSPLVVTIGIVAAAQSMRSLRWLNLGFGAWLLAAPWLVGSPAVHVLAGAGLMALASIPGRMSRRLGGGWISLLK